ncbi:MAG: hypothetical protein U0525_00465 [Patescibacteria group bacterium]
MFDKILVGVALILLSAPAASAVMLPTGAREKARELRQTNQMERQEFNGQVIETRTQFRDQTMEEIKNLRVTQEAEWKKVMDKNNQEWMDLNKQRLTEMQAAITAGASGPTIAAINLKYKDLSKGLKATNTLERKDVRLTGKMERKDVKAEVQVQKKEMLNQIKTERKTFQEEIRNSWQNFMNSFLKAKPTVTPTATQ